ncbi:hypothetical protein WG909_13985 [Peptostreptococcaceae bacterium AGR-M142]
MNKKWSFIRHIIFSIVLIITYVIYDTIKHVIKIQNSIGEISGPVAFFSATNSSYFYLIFFNKYFLALILAIFMYKPTKYIIKKFNT